MNYSMEEYADISGRNVSVSDLSQRVVTAVLVITATEEGQPAWVINFSGGAKLLNFDPMIPAPTHIVGAALNLVVLGGHDGEGAHQTELRFGLNPIYLNPLEYAIQDDGITGGHIVFVQRSRANL